MGELIKFPLKKKEVASNEKKPPVEQKAEIDFSSIEERTAINILRKDRYDFMLGLRKRNPGFRWSNAYKTYYELLTKSSRVDIANMINDKSEIEIRSRGAYFIAAFNILCDTF